MGINLSQWVLWLTTSLPCCVDSEAALRDAIAAPREGPSNEGGPTAAARKKCVRESAGRHAHIVARDSGKLATLARDRAGGVQSRQAAELALRAKYGTQGSYETRGS